MIIDSHQHFWALERGDYHWLTPSLAALYRDCMPRDLAPHLEAAGIDRTIVVQAAPTEAESYFLAGLAERYPFIAGVVGWIDFDAVDAADRVKRLRRELGRTLVGLRPMMQEFADALWVAQASLDPVFEAIGEADLVFDALVTEANLQALKDRASRSDQVRIVIDHAAKPAIGRHDRSDWRKAMAPFGRMENVACKVSGLVTEADGAISADRLRPYLMDLLEMFGPRRLLWGSDWPVLNLASHYAEWKAITDDLLAPCSDPERDAIMGGNAARIYRLGGRI